MRSMLVCFAFMICANGAWTSKAVDDGEPEAVLQPEAPIPFQIAERDLPPPSSMVQNVNDSNHTIVKAPNVHMEGTDDYAMEENAKVNQIHVDGQIFSQRLPVDDDGSGKETFISTVKQWATLANKAILALMDFAEDEKVAS
mmetsp:Transcript_1635/g.2566  ORF Transcript_1635/g.2566 Transcript_1635/m.2566 type:complete len:142 (+) Transcript_1635:87-512(+)